jgi:hypothetical protein
VAGAADTVVTSSDAIINKATIADNNFFICPFLNKKKIPEAPIALPST